MDDRDIVRDLGQEPESPQQSGRIGLEAENNTVREGRLTCQPKCSSREREAAAEACPAAINLPCDLECVTTCPLPLNEKVRTPCPSSATFRNQTVRQECF